jgi:hypothetical protein
MDLQIQESRWPALEDRLGLLLQYRATIGNLPPLPATFRGRLGMRFVWMVRRSLFWLLPQLDRFHGCSIELANEQLSALDGLAADYERLDGALGQTMTEFVRRQKKLEREVAELRAQLGRAVALTAKQDKE